MIPPRREQLKVVCQHCQRVTHACWFDEDAAVLAGERVAKDSKRWGLYGAGKEQVRAIVQAVFQTVLNWTPRETP